MRNLRSSGCYILASRCLRGIVSGSVITKDIPANIVAAGVPCKVIREITEADKTAYRP